MGSVDEVPQGHMNLVQEVFQREGVFSTSESEKPILATYGIGPCVSVMGYCKDLKRGFLVHYDDLTDRSFGSLDNSYSPPKSLMKICYWGSLGAKDTPTYNIRIIQGNENTGLLNNIESYLSSLNGWRGGGRIRLNVEDRDVEEELAGEKSIAVDLRDGRVFRYSPSKNPYRKVSSDLDNELGLLEISFPSPLKWIIDESLHKYQE